MPKPHEIKKAAEKAGLDLTDGQAKLLSDGAILPMADMNITPSAAVPWPPQLSVCCES